MKCRESLATVYVAVAVKCLETYLALLLVLFYKMVGRGKGPNYVVGKFTRVANVH